MTKEDDEDKGMTNLERAKSLFLEEVECMRSHPIECMRFSHLERALDEAEKRGQQALLDGTTDNTFIEIYGYTIKQIRQMDVWMKERDLKWSVIDEDRKQTGEKWFRLGQIEGQKEMRERAAAICDKKYPCNDSGHDDRWCARCGAMEDALNMAQQEIRALPIEGE